MSRPVILGPSMLATLHGHVRTRTIRSARHLTARARFLARGIYTPQAVADAAPTRIASLLREFDGLQRSEKDEIAGALSRLWESFGNQFGGMDGFVTASEDRKSEYVTRLREAERQFASHTHATGRHLYFAVAMMVEYLLSWQDGTPTSDARELGVRVVQLIDRGRQVAEAG